MPSDPFIVHYQRPLTPLESSPNDWRVLCALAHVHRRRFRLYESISLLTEVGCLGPLLEGASVNDRLITVINHYPLSYSSHPTHQTGNRKDDPGLRRDAPTTCEQGVGNGKVEKQDVSAEVQHEHVLARTRE